MAWYSGTFYCGHEGYINIIGPLKNREKMREYKFSGLCPACCREALLQSRNEQNAAARKAAARMELPPLGGQPEAGDLGGNSPRGSADPSAGLYR